MRLSTGTRIAALAAATALVASACSSGGSGGADGAEPDGGSADGPVDLTFWSWTPGMDKVVDLWNEQNPDIQVTVNKQDGGDDAVTKFLTAIEAGSGAPDLMQAEYPKIPQLVSSDALADISGSLGDDVAGRFTDDTWTAVTLGSDAVYAIPQDTAPMQLYYRADVFEKLGLDEPTTWEEYADAARAIHEDDPKAYLGTFSSNDAGQFAGLAQQAGASWYGIDGDSWSVDIDSEATTKVAEFWGGLVEEGVIDNKPMYTPEWNAGLADGTQVGWVSAIWAPGNLEQFAPDTAGKWRMAPLPQWDADDPANGTWGGSATAVTSQTEHAEQAAEFATWLNTDPEAVQALVEEANIYPADAESGAEALADPPEFFSHQKDFYEVAAETASNVNPFVYGPNLNVAYSSFNDAFQKAAKAKSQDQFTGAVGTMQQVTTDDLVDAGFSVAE